MAISFPSNPQLNDVYVVGTKSWSWNGYAWDLVVSSIEPVYIQANTALSIAQSAYNNSNTKFNSSGGVITGSVDIAGPVIIEGNLTVSGNVTTISANNLSIQDNMIYLNEGISGNVNPDLGFAGAYNDGTYHHAGFFRDATDGVWKVFDNYKPEPDESVYIDTSNSTFRIANFQANNIFANTFSGIANNSNYFDGKTINYFVDYTDTNISSNVNILQNVNLTQNSSISASFNQANTGVIQAQAAFAAANNVAPQIEPAFNQANTGVIQAQAAFASANNESIAKSAYGQANTANTNAANASFLSTGTVPTARLATGTADSTTFLRGDSTWQTVSGFSSTNDTTTNATYYPVFVTTAGGSTAKTSSTKLYFNPSTGTFSATIFNSLSDQKFKENVSTLDSGISVIEELNPVKFSWKGTKEYSHGFIAQELEKVIPESVYENDGIKSVNYDSLIPFLVKAIQELHIEIDRLKSKINS